MTLVQRIQSLCDSKSTTLIGLEREIGIGRGTIRKWDDIFPSIDKLQKVADYFLVSTDYLLGRTNKPDEIFIEGDSIPDVMKPFIKHDSHIIASIDIKNGSGTAAERKAAIEEILKSTNALDYSSGLEELLTLLPENKRNKPISMYDLYDIIGNDKEAMKILKEEDNEEQNKDTITLAASRTDGYDEPLTEDEAAAVKAFLETYRKMKQDKKG